jgi:DNA repair/transcription protein MET18/MMS19
MRNLPTSALLSELNQLLPIILESLKVPLSNETVHEAPLQQAAVSTLKLLIKETPETVTDHLNTVITALLAFAIDQDHSPLVLFFLFPCISYFFLLIFLFLQTLRLDAVDVITSIASLSFVRIQRFKQQVLRGLKVALDDRKRVVRRAAIKASNEWAVSSEGAA